MTCNIEDTFPLVNVVHVTLQWPIVVHSGRRGEGKWVEVRGEKESGWERETGSPEEKGKWIIRHGREGSNDSYVEQSLSVSSSQVNIWLLPLQTESMDIRQSHGGFNEPCFFPRFFPLSLLPLSSFNLTLLLLDWFFPSLPHSPLSSLLSSLLPRPLPLSLSSLSSRYLAIGEDSRCFIELDTPSLPQDHMTRIEDLCNESIRRGIPMTPRWYSPTAPELEDVSLP